MSYICGLTKNINMKKLLFLALLPLASLAFGQSTHGITASSTDKSEVTTEAFSSHQPWGTTSWSINLQGDVRNSSLFQVGTFYNLAAGSNFAIPVSLNLGFGETDSLSVQKGASVGVSPWISVYNKEGLEVVLHGALQYQMPNLSDIATGERFKALAGVEASYAVVGNLPTVVSVTPAWTRTTGVENSSLFGLEIDAIVPVRKQIGLLFGTSIPFDNSVGTGVNLGLIVKGAL